MCSAAILFVFSGLFGPLPWVAVVLITTAASVVGILRDMRVLWFALPENRRLVPPSIFARGVLAGSFQFGYELGTGIRSYVTASAPYVFALALLLSAASPASFLAAGIGFGGGRGLMAVGRCCSESESRWDTLLDRRLRWVSPVANLVAAWPLVGGFLFSPGW